jgi:hypothetical protein
MGYFVTFKVDRRVIDAASKLLEFKYRYNGEYVATVQIDWIKKSYEVVDGSFDGVAIPDENIPPGQTREDILFRNLVNSASHWMDNVWMNQQ